jgi:hypothetical protein
MIDGWHERWLAERAACWALAGPRRFTGRPGGPAGDGPAAGAAECFYSTAPAFRGRGVAPSALQALTDPDTGANLIAYQSGWGDGFYPTWIGRDHDGNVTCFVSDMLLMPNSVAAEEGP